MHHAIRRDGEPALSFEGVELARRDSERSFKKDWTELGLFRTTAGHYVVQTIGRTRRPNGYEVNSARVYNTVEELFDGLRDHKWKGGAHPRIVVDLLNDASERDDAIDNLLARIEEREEHVD